MTGMIVCSSAEIMNEYIVVSRRRWVKILVSANACFGMRYMHNNCISVALAEC